MKNHTYHLKSWITRIVVAITIAISASSCMSVDKFIKPDEKVLYKNKFSIEMEDGSKPPKEITDALDDMKKYVRQKPNTHLLGIGPRFSMRVYCLSNPEKDNFWQRYLRDKGQPPVVYDEHAAEQTSQQIAGLLKSKGCFYSTVSFDTVVDKKHDLTVIYHIKPSTRYKIFSVTSRAETPEVDKLLKQWSDECLLKEGDYYDQDVMDEERNRITEKLRNQGYYLASTDLVNYLVDTAYEDHKLSILQNIHNPVRTENKNSVVTPLQKYHIDNIYIYPNTSSAENKDASNFDTLIDSTEFSNGITHYTFLYDQPMTHKTKVIKRSLFMYHGQTFRPFTINLTYNSLLNLRNFKYINIEFSESPNSCDTNRLLDAKIRLLNAKKQRLSASIEINNSSPFGDGNNGFMSGNFGLETKINYQNKNLFGGAEILNAEVSLLVELPKLFYQNQDQELIKNFSNFENGLSLSLDLPTFLFPFKKDRIWQRMRPHTVINLGGNYQFHSYFERILFNTGFGYNWSRRRHGHQLLPLELTYVRFFNIDSTFRSRMTSISDARVKYQYSDHFIMDARYDYVYNTQQYGKRINFNYFHFSVESAGNLLAAIETLTDAPTDENGIRQIFGVPFSQYARFTTEFKRYFYFGKQSSFVARVLAGVGIPYGNSKAMPYEKSFFGGGPTTLRAWHLRYLGPGLFRSDDNSILERIGDLQLVTNLEYRFPIISIFEGALFTDIGNVWLTYKSDEFPGGQLTLENLPKSIATGIGVGLRANISIVTIRCDLAIPLYDPGHTEGHRWRPPYWNFGQMTANFGIDYPF